MVRVWVVLRLILGKVLLVYCILKGFTELYNSPGSDPDPKLGFFRIPVLGNLSALDFQG